MPLSPLGTLEVHAPGEAPARFADPYARCSSIVLWTNARSQPLKDMARGVDVSSGAGRIAVCVAQCARCEIPSTSRSDLTVSAESPWCAASALAAEQFAVCQSERSRSAEPAAVTARGGVANGIAFDARTRRLLVTGKLWPRLFDIDIADR